MPGSGGRRLDPGELARWATGGFRLTAPGPAYLFPAVGAGGDLLTTPACCAAWVRFVALARAYCRPGAPRRSPRDKARR